MRKEVKEAEELILIELAIASKIQLSLVWKDYYDVSSPEALLQADINAGLSYSLESLIVNFASSEYRNLPKFKSIVDQCDFLATEVSEEAIKILVEAQNNAQDVKKIKTKYYEVVAKRISDKFVKQRVLIAPERWLPDMFT